MWNLALASIGCWSDFPCAGKQVPFPMAQSELGKHQRNQAQHHTVRYGPRPHTVCSDLHLPRKNGRSRIQNDIHNDMQ